MADSRKEMVVDGMVDDKVCSNHRVDSLVCMAGQNHKVDYSTVANNSNCSVMGGNHNYSNNHEMDANLDCNQGSSAL